LHLAVEHADFVSGRQDVGQHEQLLIGDSIGSEVRGGVGEGHSHVLGLGAVDPVAEDPSSAAEALAIHAFPAVAARPARRDAGHQHSISDLAGLDARTDRFDCADRLMAENSPGGDRRDIALQDVEVGSADRDCVDTNNGVRVGDNARLRHLLP
jgi:hypothetical protein